MKPLMKPYLLLPKNVAMEFYYWILKVGGNEAKGNVTSAAMQHGKDVRSLQNTMKKKEITKHPYYLRFWKGLATYHVKD